MIKLFRFLRPFIWQIIAALSLILTQVLGDLFLPTLMADIIDQGVMKSDTLKILQLGGWMILVSLGSISAAFLASFLSSRISTFFGAQLRAQVFTHVTQFTLQEFDKFGTSTLITRSTNDVTQIQQVVMMILRMLVMAPIMAVGGILMAYWKDPSLTWVFAVTIPIMGLAILILASQATPLFRSIQSKVDTLNRVLREGLLGIRVIRAFGRTEYEEQRFDQANGDITSVYIRVNRIMAFMMPLMMLIMNFTTVAILWFGIIKVDIGEMQLGSLMAFTQYAMQILFAFLMMSMMFIMIPRAQAAAQRINEILEEEPGIKDPLEPLSPESTLGEVEFHQVSFRYLGAESPALSKISFKAPPGKVTAIIGSTGSGKSTLLKLIPRFYDVEEGAIFVDGVDLRKQNQAQLRKKIGYVPQKTILFAGTIRDNITFGTETVQEEMVHAAAQVAQAQEFIDTLEKGYDHQISQGGSNISGGQKQRLSIARALSRKPEIYLFDDSFSALDFKTDRQLRDALKKNIAGATVILVAQRVGTVMDADQIIVLEEGQIVDRGTHKELLATSRVYQEIAASQLSQEELA